MLSLILRRTHMYLALFLFPWVLVYTLSTLAMNHHSHLRTAGEGPPRWEPVAERSYARDFAPETPAAGRARQILRDLDLDGAYTTSKPAPDGTLVINRQDPIRPKRITYRPRDHRVTVEAQPFTKTSFLERMHRRRGFQQRYFADIVWGSLVDLFILAMIVWALSGLWMWWEMKVTRLFGAIALLGGIGLFAFFMTTI
jgi:hypothetical protein